MKLFQLTVAFAIGALSIYVGDVLEYDFNPWFVGAWMFMGAFAATLATIGGADVLQ